MELPTPPNTYQSSTVAGGSQDSPSKQTQASPAGSDPSGATISSDEESSHGTCPHVAEAFADASVVAKFKSAVGWGVNAKDRCADGGPPSKRRKLQYPACGTCGITLHRPFTCLHCSFIGCWSARHIVAHLEQTSHQFCVDVKSGSVFCIACDDFILHNTVEALLLSSVLAAEEKKTRFQEASKGRESFKRWIPDAKDTALLENTTTVVCRGRRGLLNLGSTCYLNVILQTLIHNPLLRNYFLSDKHNNKLCKNKDCMCCEMDKLFAEIYSDNVAPHGPVTFLHAMWQASSELAGYAQQDAHEFFISALNQIHANSRGSTNISCNCIIHSTFAGQLRSDLKCGKCGHNTWTSDPMLDLSLELRGLKSGPGVKADENTLEACLRRFTKPEKLGPKEYTCSKCKANDITKRLSIHRLPPVLCFQLKRFEHKTSSSKIDTPIRFPAVLNMSPYTSLAVGIDANEGGKHGVTKSTSIGPESLYDYDLFAVVNHEGQMNTGHYTNFARFQDEWYRFDDDKVTHSSLRECLSSTAYMCFYVKRHLDYKPYQRPSYVVSRETQAEKERVIEKEREMELMRQREKEIDDSLAMIS